MKILLIGVLIGFCSALAAPPPLLYVVENSYKKAKSIKISLSKTVTLKLLNRVNVSKGVLTAKGDQIALELDSESKSQYFSKGNDFWIIEYPPADFSDQPVKVMEGKHNDKSSVANAIFSFFVGSTPLKEHFRIISEKVGEKIRTYELKPLGDGWDFKLMKVECDVAKEYITKITYTDSLNNQIQYDLEFPDFNKKISSSFFEKKIPAGAEVVRIN